MRVENLDFTFDSTVEAFQYETAGVLVNGWPNGTKVVDAVGNEIPAPPATTWLIEAKDFRIITNPPKPANVTGLPATVEGKVRSTIAAFPIVAATSTNAVAKAHAAAATTAVALRVVLHLEPHPPGGPQSHLFPKGFPASVLMKLKQLVSDIDSNPVVLDILRTAKAGVPWSVA